MPDRSRSQLVSTPCASGSRSHGADVAPLPCANGYPLAEGSCRTGTADRQGWLTGETDHWCKTSASATSADRRAGGQRAEVDVEHVGVDQGEFAVRARGGGERLQQVAVEFDRRERAVALEQREGHRALAGTDLDQPVAGLGVDGVAAHVATAADRKSVG